MDDIRIFVGLLAILGYALLSRRLERWWISMPMAMIVVGFLAGVDGFGLIDVDPRSETVKVAAELTLALMLFHDAVRIDLRALRKGYKLPLRLLGIGLPVMLLLGTGVALGLLPGIGLIGAALLATMLAPTDAALGEAVVSDERIPVTVRQGLNVESGLNDGLSVPIFIVLLAAAADPAALESGVLIAELARQIGFGILGGLVIGGVGGVLFRAAVDRDAIGGAWRRIAILILAVGSYVCAAALGGSGFIGAFVGGVLFGLASEARSPQDNAFTGYLGTFFDAFSFLLLGAMLLPLAIPAAGWREVGYAVLSLVVLRLGSVVLATLGSGAKWPTVAFMGWFGPRGLATVVFTVMLIDEAIPNGETIAAVAVICVVLSAFAHGISAPPLVTAYSRWWKRTADSATPGIEDQDVFEHACRAAIESPASASKGTSDRGEIRR